MNTAEHEATLREAAEIVEQRMDTDQYTADEQETSYNRAAEISNRLEDDDDALARRFLLVTLLGREVAK